MRSITSYRRAAVDGLADAAALCRWGAQKAAGTLNQVTRYARRQAAKKAEVGWREVRKLVNDNPGASLLAASVAGFVIGRTLLRNH